ncbi:MerR family transcriptional regulator [Acinetobacter qingfengensis]|uniref:MerR family transcriptional regulator n=1 Tax=Acinetobacter qingfengensis TaxID=1262585 RepID=A0A1E7QXD1_9GAMM|nr:MerR family transcriptional regulator [Acinetobacter qingfengensis]KAA8731617.1 MerR family transcriptional regulator [Acinetobacter qingfengensis]OEY91720.1 MerR family transcriptional regulator [Acinetobacter qingfengensis]
MYIGQLAALTGATQKAIRHYEALGLLPIPQRKGNYRIYDPIHVHLIKMIHRAKAVGFSLAEITELAQIKAQQKRFPLDLAQQLFQQKHQQIRQQQEKLALIEKNLTALELELIDLYKKDKDLD